MSFFIHSKPPQQFPWNLNHWLPAFYHVWCITRFASNQFKASSNQIKIKTSACWAVRLSILRPGSILHTLHISDCNKFSVTMQATVCLNTAMQSDLHKHFSLLNSQNARPVIVVVSGGNEMLPGQREASETWKMMWRGRPGARRYKRRREMEKKNHQACDFKHLLTHEAANSAHPTKATRSRLRRRVRRRFSRLLY